MILAKQKVYGQVGIDQLPGPTETLIVADAHADPAEVAADLLAQAEHDFLATPLLITDSAALAARVEQELAAQLAALPRREEAAYSLKHNGGIVVVADLQTAIDAASEYAPEHLCLLTQEPWQWVGKIRNAGGIFVGSASPEVLGDYIAGPSHVMPVGGHGAFFFPNHGAGVLQEHQHRCAGLQDCRRDSRTGGCVGRGGRLRRPCPSGPQTRPPGMIAYPGRGTTRRALSWSGVSAIPIRPARQLVAPPPEYVS